MSMEYYIGKKTKSLSPLGKQWTELPVSTRMWATYGIFSPFEKIPITDYIHFIYIPVRA